MAEKRACFPPSRRPIGAFHQGSGTSCTAAAALSETADASSTQEPPANGASLPHRSNAPQRTTPEPACDSEVLAPQKSQRARLWPMDGTAGISTSDAVQDIDQRLILSMMADMAGSLPPIASSGASILSRAKAHRCLLPQGPHPPGGRRRRHRRGHRPQGRGGCRELRDLAFLAGRRPARQGIAPLRGHLPHDRFRASRSCDGVGHVRPSDEAGIDRADAHAPVAEAECGGFRKAAQRLEAEQAVEGMPARKAMLTMEPPPCPLMIDVQTCMPMRGPSRLCPSPCSTVRSRCAEGSMPHSCRHCSRGYRGCRMHRPRPRRRLPIGQGRRPPVARRRVGRPPLRSRPPSSPQHPACGGACPGMAAGQAEMRDH